MTLEEIDKVLNEHNATLHVQHRSTACDTSVPYKITLRRPGHVTIVRHGASFVRALQNVLNALAKSL